MIDAEGGTPRQITTGPGSQTVPRWSRDGRWIYFSNNDDGARDIWRVRATGGQPEQVTRTGSGFQAYEVGAGASILYQPVNGDSALLLLPLTGNDRTKAARRLRPIGGLRHRWAQRRLRGLRSELEAAASRDRSRHRSRPPPREARPFPSWCDARQLCRVT
jgi:hypothetical protein